MTSNKLQRVVDASFSASNENKNIEDENSSQETTTVELKNNAFAKETSIPQTSQISSESLQCPTHPDEELQFYCFNNGAIVCGECLVSGNYTGTEIANLKKAADKIREKMTTMQTQRNDRSQASSKLEADVKATEAAIEDAIDQYKNDVKSKMEALRQEIDKKEQEILHKLDNLREERLKRVTRSPNNSPSNKDDIKELGDILAKESNKFNDLNLCRYYSKKANTFNIPVKEIKETSSQALLKRFDSFNTQDSQNLAKLKEDYEKIVKSLQSFGENISKNPSEIKIDLTDNLEQVLESTKAKLKSISLSENTNYPQNKIDLIRKYSSNRDTTKANTGTNLALKLKNTSSFLNQMDSAERELTSRSKTETRLYTESDKDNYSIFTSNRNKTPPSSRKIDIIGAYRDQLSKISYTKERGHSSRPLKTEGNEDRITNYQSNVSSTKKYVDSVLAAHPGKKSGPAHYSYNTFLDVKTPSRTVADLFPSRQDSSQTTKAGSRRNNYFSGADLDRIFSDNKASVREKPEQKSSNQLKSKLIAFNFKKL